MHEKICAHLKARGACFMVELQSACGPGTRPDEISEALWDLVWWGMVTNDTFAALRAHGQPKSRRVGRGGRRGSRSAAGGGGRWSLVQDLLFGEVDATTRAHARAVTLLERHGLVTREAAALEELPGGFSAVYRVLKAMEEAGKVRRGYFVEQLGGAQFASPGAVDRIRAVRDPGEDDTVVVLSAIDPANPYGWLLPWPVRAETDRSKSPRRVAGASVVFVGGEAVLYLDKGGKRLRTFVAADDPVCLSTAMGALAKVAARRRGRTLRIETVDGEPARTSRFADALRDADFRSDVRGLTLEAPRS